MTISLQSALIATSVEGPDETTALSTSSMVAQAVNRKLAQFLVVARERTINERKELLSFLASAREPLLDCCKGKEIFLQTENGSIINGAHFAGTQKKGIIFLHGNGGFYETAAPRPLGWIESLKQKTSEDTDLYPHLVVFNPEGTGKSNGIPHPDAVAEDILAAFEYLVHQHSIDPNDIVIAGHSMGAYFAAFGAELVQQKFPTSNINFLSDRSYDQIRSRVDSKIKDANHSKPVEYVYSSTMHTLLAWSHWNRSSAAVLEGLKGRVCIIYHKGDAVIPYVTSTHEALTQIKRTRNYSCLALKEKGNSSELTNRAHNREFNQEEHQLIITELKRMLRLPLTTEEEGLSLDVLEASHQVIRSRE